MGRVKLWCAEAQAAGRHWQRHRHPPLAPPDGGNAYTVRHAFWDWLEWRRKAGLPLHPYRTTYRRYLGPALGSLPLVQLEQRDIVRWRDGIAATPAWDSAVRFPHIGEVETGSALFEAIRRRRCTANSHLLALKNALDHAHLHGLVDSSIGWRGVRLFRRLGRYRPLVLEPEEIETLIGLLDPPVRHLVEAVWHSGARIGEIVSLTPERVLAAHRKIIVIDSKKRTARGIALTRRGAQFFAGHARDRGHGEIPVPQSPGRALDRAARRQRAAKGTAAHPLAGAGHVSRAAQLLFELPDRRRRAAGGGGAPARPHVERDHGTLLRPYLGLGHRHDDPAEDRQGRSGPGLVTIGAIAGA